jgi:hypothetical protein
MDEANTLSHIPLVGGVNPQSRYSVCKKYIKKYIETNPEALKIAKKKYVEKHKSEIKEYQKDYHQDYYKWRQFLYNTSYKYELFCYETF